MTSIEEERKKARAQPNQPTKTTDDEPGTVQSYKEYLYERLRNPRYAIGYLSVAYEDALRNNEVDILLIAMEDVYNANKETRDTLY